MEHPGLPPGVGAAALAPPADQPVHELVEGSGLDVSFEIAGGEALADRGFEFALAEATALVGDRAGGIVNDLPQPELGVGAHAASRSRHAWAISESAAIACSITSPVIARPVSMNCGSYSATVSVPRAWASGGTTSHRNWVAT